MKQIRGMLFEDPDGDVTVMIVPKGSMVMEAEVPTPWMSETERQGVFSKARDQAWLDGYVIEWERRVRNPLSDKGKQTTTLRIKLRPCCNDDEVAYVEAQMFRITGLQRSALQ